ncbi:TRAP transporter small permease [Hirschia maritima]|uniref:TRAP transporter small permease n=1 Tax=Hirschia maritima TaxID=1121961 RepID=UPI00035F842A|nr:TRAP transporter small permease [Hirschia maritima]
MIEGRKENTEIMRWFDWPAVVILFAIIGVVLLQFFTRYFLNDSLTWTEEISRYLLICLVFTGAVSAMNRGELIFLEVIFRYAPLSNAKPMAIIGEACCIVFYGLFAVGTFLLSSSVSQSLISIEIPKVYFYILVGVCLIVLLFGSIRRLLGLLQLSSEEIFAIYSPDNKGGIVQ